MKQKEAKLRTDQLHNGGFRNLWNKKKPSFIPTWQHFETCEAKRSQRLTPKAEVCHYHFLRLASSHILQPGLEEISSVVREALGAGFSPLNHSGPLIQPPWWRDAPPSRAVVRPGRKLKKISLGRKSCTHRNQLLNLFKLIQIWIVITLFDYFGPKRNSVWHRINQTSVITIQILFHLKILRNRFLHHTSYRKLRPGYTAIAGTIRSW